MAKFVIRAEHFIKPGQMQKWLELALMNSRESLKETGVERFDISVSQDDSNHALIYEIYESREHWLAHCESAHFKAFVDGIQDLVVRRERGYFSLLTD